MMIMIRQSKQLLPYCFALRMLLLYWRTKLLQSRLVNLQKKYGMKLKVKFQTCVFLDWLTLIKKTADKTFKVRVPFWRRHFAPFYKFASLVKQANNVERIKYEQLDQRLTNKRVRVPLFLFQQQWEVQVTIWFIVCSWLSTLLGCFPYTPEH